MRFSYALLLAAAAAAVLASGETAPGVSRMGSPVSVISLGGNIDAEKRFLRVDGNQGRPGNADDEEEEEEEGEERKGTNMFVESKLDEMADHSTQLISRFRKWKSHGYTFYNLPDVVLASKYDELRKQYRKWLYKIQGQR